MILVLPRKIELGAAFSLLAVLFLESGCAPKNLSAARGAARSSLRAAKISNPDAYEVKEAARLLEEGEHAYTVGQDQEAFRYFRDAEDLSRGLYSGAGPSYIPDEKDIFHLNKKPRAEDPVAFLDHISELQWLRPREDLTANKNEIFPWENQKLQAKPRVFRFLEDEDEDPLEKFARLKPSKPATEPLIASAPAAAWPKVAVAAPPDVPQLKSKTPTPKDASLKPAFPTARKVEDIKKEGLSEIPLVPLQNPLDRANAFKEKMPGSIAFGAGDRLFQSSSRHYLDALQSRLKKEPQVVAVFQGQVGEGESIDLVEDRFDMVKRYLLEAGVDEDRLTLDDKRIVGEWPEMRIFLLK